MKKVMRKFNLIISVALLMGILASTHVFAVDLESNCYYEPYNLLGPVDAMVYGFNSDTGKVVIPETLGGMKVTGMSHEAGSKTLKTLVIPKTMCYIERYETDSYMDWFDSLEKIIVDPGNPVFGSAKGMLYEKKSGKLLHCPIMLKTEKLVIPKKIKCFNICAMDGCKNIKELVFKNNVKKLSNSFMRMKNLRKVSIAGSVKKIEGSAFSQNKKLQVVELHNGTKIIDIAAFQLCSKLKTINIPKTVKLIKEVAFDQCPKLKQVKIPKKCKLEKGAFPKTCKIIRY